jgi:RNA polymerase sigma-70 factor (ECF subfamily)
LENVVDIHRDLVAKCRIGDRKAQYELYKSYSKAMFNIAMRITNNYMEAEDVLQEAFIRAFRSLESFKGDSTIGAWIKRIVINTAINHLKRNRLDPMDMEKYEQTPDPEPEGTTSFPWSVEEVRRSIQLLPEGYRIVLTLYLIDGYDHGEIAEILNISEATSKSQFSRAKKKLREILTEYQYERST